MFESHDDVQQLVIAFKDVILWIQDLRLTAYSYSSQLNKSADSAHGNDAATLKPVVVHWLMSAEPAEPALEPGEKDGQGFDHEVTGRLLCPVDYDWHDPE